MLERSSKEVKTIVAQADVVARATGRPTTSVHYLVATYLVQCQARELLVEAGVDDARVLDTYEKMADREDAAEVISEIHRQAEQLAESSNVHDVTSTILLASLLRVRHALAWKVLDRAGVNVPTLRAKAIGQVTLSQDRATTGVRPAVRSGDEPRPTGRLDMPRSITRTDMAAADPSERVDRLRARPLPADLLSPHGASGDERAAKPEPRPDSHRLDQRYDAGRSEPNRFEHPRAEQGRPEPRVDGARSETLRGDSFRPEPLRSDNGRLEPSRSDAPRPDDVTQHDAARPEPRQESARVDAPRVEPPRAEPSKPPAERRSLLPAPIDKVAEPKPARAPAPRPLGRVFEVSPDQFPTLCELGRNLTEAALQGEIDPLIGRDRIVDEVIDILLMKQVNNPCLVGEAGVGKTAIAEGLALRLAGNVEQYGRLGTAAVIEIQTSSLLAGTALRGAFSDRMKRLREEVARAEGQVIIFMDEVHTIMGAGTGDGPLDAANDLKSALSRGKFPLIGATTKAEYERHILKDPAMERRFQVVAVPEPTVLEAIAILSGVAPIYARHHSVRYSHEAIVSTVHLSKRFITDRCLPDKAIAVLDRAGAQTRRAGRPQVQADDVARAVHGLTAVPLDRLLADERGRIRDLAADLQARIVGHDLAMARIARRIQRNYAGFSADRPVASFLFVGAPGVGKTETARALSEALFVTSDALVRFDMTEYAEAHSVSRLIGSPPGYVGHAQMGLLSQALQKRPYRVLLFDEIDRAAPEVVALLLQLLDAGRITDHHGQLIDVRNCIIVMTSNLGADLLASGIARRAIGFGRIDAPLPEGPPGDPLTEAVLERARAAFPAEFWSRIDDAIVFRPLAPLAARQIVLRTLEASAQRLFDASLIRYDVDDAVVDLVLAQGLDPALGVRPLRARVESLVESFVTECILDGSLRPGAEVQLTVLDGAVVMAESEPVRPAP